MSKITARFEVNGEGLVMFRFKGTLMKIKKALINDCLRISEVTLKFRILTIYNFALIYQSNLSFSYFLTVSIFLCV